MSNSYTWEISAVFTKNVTESGTTYSNVLGRVLGVITCTSDSTSEDTEHGLDLNLRNPSDWSTFTPYADITKTNVIDFIETRLGSDLTEIKERMAERVAFQDTVHGLTEQDTLPWA